MSQYQVRFSVPADEDLLQILDFIAQDKPLAALDFVDELQTVAKDTLGIFPRAGVFIEEIQAWFYPHKRYVFVYDIDDESKIVIIHMISQAARQWKSVFLGRL